MPKGRPRFGAQKEKPIELDLYPPEGQPVRQTNQLLYLSRTIMNALIRHDESWPFLELLTPQKINIPKYYEIVTRPMSLRVIKKRLHNWYYWSANDAIKDIRLVFKNAYKVCGPNSAMRKMAKHLDALLRIHLQSMPGPEMEIGPKGKPIQIVRPQIPLADMERDSVLDGSMDDHDDEMSNNPVESIDGNDGTDEQDSSGGSDAMMEFALRRLERLCGVDRSQARKAYAASNSDAEAVVFGEVYEARETEFEMNEGHSPVAVSMELETFEADVAASSKRIVEIAGDMRLILDIDIDIDSPPTSMPDREIVLVDATQDYSFSQGAEFGQFVLHDDN